jgi:hypothetical protein
MGSSLFPAIGETTNVPLSTPKVANKLTTYIKDFAKGIEISKNLFDDKLNVSHIVVALNNLFPTRLVLV